jgi:ferredoxin-NADP reductase
MKLKFVSSRDRTTDVKEFVFEVSPPLTWQAGQYLHYVLPHDNADDRGEERWFTISSAPTEREIRITTRIDGEHSSSFKSALQALQPGDTIEADGPEGDFTVTDLSRNYVFVAGGIGITPLRSMLMEADAKGRRLHVQLLYPNRNNDIPFKDELDSLQTKNPNLKVQYIVQPQRLTPELLQQTIQATENPAIYISGPEPMVKSLAAEVERIGVGKDNIKTDDFPGYEAD